MREGKYMKMRVGIVGFSFGLRSEREEPNPSNQALAEEVDRAASYVNFYDSRPVVVTQWEITKGLAAVELEPDHTVGLLADGTYLGSKDVWEEARGVFEEEGVEQVIIIAQPFLHLPALKKMVRRDEFVVLPFPVRKIPFDNSLLNTQPWTRSKPALAWYAVRSLLGMQPGHGGMQHAQP
jgi:hypothetical protein